MSMVLYEVAGNGDMRPSPYCWRIKWALAHKLLDFAVRTVPYTAIATIGDGSFTRVPVLEHDGIFLKESFEIARYLDETFPDRPLLLRSGAAVAAFFDEWTEQAIHNPTFRLVVADMHARLQPVDQDYFRISREGFLGMTLEEARRWRDELLPDIRQGFEALRAALAKAPFLGGDDPEYVDYIVASGFRWLSEVSTFAIVEPTDPVAAWLERLRQLRG